MEYILKRSTTRKTIGLKVDEAGLTVYAPKRCSATKIEELITLKQSWIKKHLETYKRVKKNKPTFEQDGVFRFKGQKLKLNIIQAEKISIIATETELHIHTPHTEPDLVQQALFKWFHTEAQHFIEARTHETAALLNQTVPKIVFGKYKTKWGSCHANGQIKFNWLLMQAPVPVIDYVIAHEVSHLIEMNHSSKFWAVVESICPDYKNCRKWLKEHSAMLILT